MPDPKSVEIEIKVSVNCPLKAACPHAKIQSPLLAPAWMLENANEKIAALESEIKNREAETQKGNRCCANCKKTFNERIAELEAERSELKRYLANALVNYEDYRKACDARDVLHSRINSAIAWAGIQTHGHRLYIGMRNILEGFPVEKDMPPDSEKARADELQKRIDKAKARVSDSKIILDSALHNELQDILAGRGAWARTAEPDTCPKCGERQPGHARCARCNAPLIRPNIIK